MVRKTMMGAVCAGALLVGFVSTADAQYAYYGYSRYPDYSNYSYFYNYPGYNNYAYPGYYNYQGDIPETGSSSPRYTGSYIYYPRTRYWDYDRFYFPEERERQRLGGMPYRSSDWLY